VRRYVTSPGEYEAYLEIRNFSDKPVTCDVTLSVVLAKTCSTNGECPSGFECDQLLKTCAKPAGRHPAGVSLPPRGVWRKIVPQLQSDGGASSRPPSRASSRDVFPVDNRATPTSRHAAPRDPLRHRAEPVLEALLLLFSAERRREDRAQRVPAEPDTHHHLRYGRARHEGPARQLPIYIRPTGKFAPMDDDEWRRVKPRWSRR